MATLPINQLNGKHPTDVCPILNVHRCNIVVFLFEIEFSNKKNVYDILYHIIFVITNL